MNTINPYPRRTFVVSDIHGCNQTFQQLLKKIEFSHDDQLFLLGDYIDRGPNSKGVFDTILNLMDQDYSVACILGNHEEILLQAVEDFTTQKAKKWYYFHGGKETLQSFGIGHPKDIPSQYIDFVQSLPYYIEFEQYILVHAGLNLQISKPFTDHYSILWMRKYEQTVNLGWLDGRRIIHGHTPTDKQQIQQSILDVDTIIGIDNGCAYPVNNLNNLCALELESQALYFHPNID